MSQCGACGWQELIHTIGHEVRADLVESLLSTLLSWSIVPRLLSDRPKSPYNALLADYESG